MGERKRRRFAAQTKQKVFDSNPDSGPIHSYDLCRSWKPLFRDYVIGRAEWGRSFYVYIKPSSSLL